MTLSSLMTVGSSPFTQTDQMYNADRTISTGSGWKAGKGNPNTALSALTLLAFLFFLNILQNCLKDTIGQNTPTVVMMVPTDATTRLRSKRETQQDINCTEDNSSSNSVDDQITNLVHNHVASYWSDNNGFAKISNTPLKYTSELKIHSEFNNGQHKISKLSNAMNKTIHNKKMKLKNADVKYPAGDIIKAKKTRPPISTKISRISSWAEAFSSIYKGSRVYIGKAFCCQMVLCHLNNNEVKNTNESSIAIRLISQTINWICGSSSTEECSYFGQCQKPLKRSLIKTIIELLNNFY